MCSSLKKQVKNPFPESVKCVAITTLASTPDREKILKTVELLNGFAIKTVLPDDLFQASGIKELPSSVQSRLKGLYDCWLDDSIDMIISSRGGYGSAQLLDEIDWKKLSVRRVPLLGYSDITALHLAMYKHNTGIPVIAPMGEDFFKILDDEVTFSSFEQVMNKAMEVNQNPSKIIIEQKFFANMPEESLKKVKIIKAGRVIGNIIPVNLTTFASIIGTPYMPDLTGAIILFEDINEELYKIDRLLTHIKQAGFFARFAGVAFGNFRNCGNDSGRNHLFAKFADYVNGPVISGVSFGHCSPTLSFILGERVVLDV
jgi:muramoyltetrapeptide carboxypeptidase